VLKVCFFSHQPSTLDATYFFCGEDKEELWEYLASANACKKGGIGFKPNNFIKASYHKKWLRGELTPDRLCNAEVSTLLKKRSIKLSRKMEILIASYFSNIYCPPAFPPQLDYCRVSWNGFEFADCVETAIRVNSYLIPFAFLAGFLIMVIFLQGIINILIFNEQRNCFDLDLLAALKPTDRLLNFYRNAEMTPQNSNHRQFHELWAETLSGLPGVSYWMTKQKCELAPSKSNIQRVFGLLFTRTKKTKKLNWADWGRRLSLPHRTISFHHSLRSKDKITVSFTHGETKLTCELRVQHLHCDLVCVKSSVKQQLIASQAQLCQGDKQYVS